MMDEWRRVAVVGDGEWGGDKSRGWKMGGRWVEDGWKMGGRWVEDGWKMGGRWVEDGWKMGGGGVKEKTLEEWIEWWRIEC